MTSVAPASVQFVIQVNGFVDIQCNSGAAFCNDGLRTNIYLVLRPAPHLHQPHNTPCAPLSAFRQCFRRRYSQEFFWQSHSCKTTRSFGLHFRGALQFLLEDPMRSMWLPVKYSIKQVVGRRISGHQGTYGTKNVQRFSCRFHQIFRRLPTAVPYGRFLDGLSPSTMLAETVLVISSVTL